MAVQINITIITVQEIRAALSASRRTALSLEEIHHQMLSHLSEPAIEALLRFFNKVWVLGKIPKAWRNAIIVPFLTPGNSPASPNSRPLALTSCLVKSFQVA